MSIDNQKIIPTLESENLILREITLNDDKDLFAIRSHPEVNKFLDRKVMDSEVQAMADIVKLQAGAETNEYLFWAICLKSKDSTDKQIISKMIGTICLWNFSDDRKKAEIGYELLPLHQGKNIMFEAVERICRYGFDQLNLDTIEAYTKIVNLKSTKLLEKSGFVPIKSLDLIQESHTQLMGEIIYARK
jgi:ribosomal-protein-alanine N-acetyltransferase